MENKIYFVKQPESLSIDDLPENVILTWHPMYQPPNIKGVEYIEWEKFKIMYSQLEPGLIILVGLNRMITPSNRCDYVHEYLTTMTPNMPKISIDVSPFMGEPWRLFFHYLFAGVNDFGVNYSYPIEREWQDWFYRETNDCRLSGENIKLFIRHTYSDLTPLKMNLELFEPSDVDEKWYEEARSFVFEKFDTPKLLISNLLKLSNKRFGIDLDYDTYLKGAHVKLPNLGIYRFMKEENERRMNIYNAFTNENLQ